jgi:uncharacterized protein
MGSLSGTLLKRHPSLGANRYGNIKESFLTREGTKMAGYYVLSKTDSGAFRFALKAGNHEIILASENYVAKNSAEKGIASVQKNAPDDTKYERLIAKDGQFYFNLKAGNGEIIGTSEMYTSTQGRDNGIESVQKNGPTTDIRDKTTPDA